MNRFPLRVVVLNATLVAVCAFMTPERWHQVERYPELAEYIGAHDWDDIVDRMQTGEWYRPAYQAELPDHQDAHVEFGAGE